MANDVKVLKLITGEELITRMTESDNGFLILEKPMFFTMGAPNATGKLGIGMVDWIMAGKADKVTIEAKHILVILDPKSEMEKTYLSRITGLSL
jgi:hypothetical protein